MISFRALYQLIIDLIGYAFFSRSIKCPSTARIEGKIVIITGANRGIGRETALDLATRGADKLILACRDKEAADRTVQEIILKTGNPNVIAMYLDLSSFRSIKQFADKFTGTHNRLDILISNAGIINGSEHRKLTEDGLEEHLQVNHLGPLYMISLLLPLLVQSSSSSPSRIIMVSSLSHRFMLTFDLDNINSTSCYHSSIAYFKSKLAVQLATTHLGPKLIKDNVTINTICPGIVATDLFRNYHQFLILGVFGWMTVTSEQGAQTVVYSAIEPSLDKVTGQNFRFCKPKAASCIALDACLAEKTYHTSMDLIANHINQSSHLSTS